MPHNTQSAVFRRWLPAIFAWAILVGHISPGLAEPPPKIAPESIDWKPSAIFDKDDKDDKFEDQPRMNLSGAACVPTTPKFTSCLIANDEKRYAQFFAIKDNVLVPQKLIRLSKEDKDPDAEGVAYADGYFYVTGSHGRSRTKDKENESSYAVFRIAVDPTTGVPKVEPDEKNPAGVEPTSRLRNVIRDDAVLKDFFNTPLAENGVNIEGIAARGGKLHFGLRGPSKNDHAFLLTVDANALFTKAGALDPKRTTLKLGKDTGIRDLAAVGDGVLILAGPVHKEAVPYAVWWWDGQNDDAKPLATLDLSMISADAKAEILLPLEEAGGDIRVLVMFDGMENGGAKSFKIRR